MSISETITVSLGDLRGRAEARVASGAYASVSDVLRAGLRALDREEAAAEAVLREKVQQALDDDSPSIPASQVFAELRAHHAKRMAAARNDG